MSERPDLEKIAQALKKKKKLEQPEVRTFDDVSLDEDAQGFDAKHSETIIQNVMTRRHKIKKKHPEKIEQIELDCNHPNQTEDYQNIDFDKPGQYTLKDDLLLTDLDTEDNSSSLMVCSKVAPIEVSVVDETQSPVGNRGNIPVKSSPREGNFLVAFSQLSPRQHDDTQEVVTARDIRLASVSSDSSDIMDEELNIDTVSMHSSGSSRSNDSPIDRRMTRSENLTRGDRNSARGARCFSSASQINEKEFNSTANTSRQEVLKKMQQNMRKSRREHKAEMAIIEKQRQRRREIAVKAKEETIKEEIMKGTYSERLEHTLNGLLKKFEEDQNDDINTLRSAMQLLTTGNDKD